MWPGASVVSSTMACDTPEYKAVHKQDNLTTLITAIKGVKEVYDKLQSKFKAIGWYEPPKDKAKEARVLAIVALNKIGKNVKNYEVFIKMLNEVDLNDVVDMIQSRSI